MNNRVGDIVKTLNIPGKESKPKKIIYELSEDKTYYNCEIYFDMVVDGEIREVIVTTKAREPNYAYDFRIIQADDKEAPIFTFTIPDMNE